MWTVDVAAKSTINGDTPQNPQEKLKAGFMLRQAFWGKRELYRQVLPVSRS
jgi:hypothetical protein